jgi:hypothetical protein
MIDAHNGQGAFVHIGTAMTWIGIGGGIAAASWWWSSAQVQIPDIDLNWIGQAPKFIGALKYQSELSARAAYFAAGSVLCQALSQLALHVGRRKALR